VKYQILILIMVWSFKASWLSQNFTREKRCRLTFRDCILQSCCNLCVC